MSGIFWKELRNHPLCNGYACIKDEDVNKKMMQDYENMEVLKQFKTFLLLANIILKN